MDWKRRIYYSLGPKSRRIVRRLFFLPADLWEKIRSGRDPMVPPKGMIFTGPGDFKALGKKLRSDLIEYAVLQPGHHVLDIGSGIGRVAIPLTEYLDKTGSYEGFDIVKSGIDWCSEKITPRFPNFHFTYYPLRNDLYNLDNNNQASEFSFPYPNEHFDLVILTSVFTHMQPEDVRHYLLEISRMMKKDAKCFVTFFLIDQEAMSFLQRSKDPFFKFDHVEYMLHDDKVKDANIAYKQIYLEQMVGEAGLSIASRHPGWWAGRDRSKSVDFQDLLILRKT